jgi:hypothetical protein
LAPTFTSPTGKRQLSPAAGVPPQMLTAALCRETYAVQQILRGYFDHLVDA